MSEGKVETAIKNGIATVQFMHPQSNSLPGVLLMNLAAEIEKAGNNTDVKVIVLKSEGEKTFCAGASFDELISISDLATGKKFFSGFASVINAMRKTPKFVIARVQGKTVGGGVGLAAAADYTLATDAASAKLSELNVGIGPFVVGPAVERKIGTSAFSSMSINAAEWMSAEWAREKGLYVNVYPTIPELDKAVDELVNRLAQSNPEAMALLKKVFWQGTEGWDKLLIERAEMSGKLVLSEFTRNFISKFKQGAR
ncbi:MAG TPA: enoyl-CoA hydratase/isomerase family protein [Bacteroidia bacterium]|jgi:methylglutaconyl-CoA hydratase|nr:enoyl-CoA hydratase/isomerase family protein [Bacteroidia bacterium]